jgi:hypothetical protein
MPRVPYKKIKNKINYTVSTPRQQKRVTHRATSRHVISWGSNIRPGGFRRNLYITRLKSKEAFLQGGKPELAYITGGVKTY